MSFADQITAVITTSPIPAHPSTRFIDGARGSIRHHLPDIPIVILADGVHPNHASYVERYEAYLAAIRSKWPNELKAFPEFMHQGGMIKAAFSNGWIQTPLVLWVEHDMILTQDSILWDAIVQTLLVDREADSVRFSDTNFSLAGGWQTSPMDLYVRTVQSKITLLYTTEFMTWPNLARRELYEAIISFMRVGQTHFEFVGRAFMDTKDGAKFQLTIYDPPLRQRSVNLNGRNADCGDIEMSKPPLQE